LHRNFREHEGKGLCRGGKEVYSILKKKEKEKKRASWNKKK